MRKPLAVMLAASIALSGTFTGVASASAGVAAIAPAVGQTAQVTDSAVEQVGYKYRNKHRSKRFYRGRSHRSHHYHRNHHYQRDNGSAAAAAIIGLGIGTILGGALAAPSYQRPDWHAYCASKFRSYDARSGTYLGFDGRRHYCR